MTARSSKRIELTILSDEANDIAEAIRQRIADNNDFIGADGHPLLTLKQIAQCPEDVNSEAVTVLLADPDLASRIFDTCSALFHTFLHFLTFFKVTFFRGKTG